MNILYRLLLVAALLGQNANAGDASRGEGLYKKCILCHGDKGQGNPSQKAPMIAGQHEWYIVSSLLQFRSLERKNAVMLPFIKNLSKTDFEDLASYINKL